MSVLLGTVPPLCAVAALKTESYDDNFVATDNNFVVSGDSTGCYNILRCHRWRQTWHADISALITRFMGPIWGPSGSDRTQVGPMLAPWTLLSGLVFSVHFVDWNLVSRVTIEFGNGLLHVSHRIINRINMESSIVVPSRKKKLFKIYLKYQFFWPFCFVLNKCLNCG